MDQNCVTNKNGSEESHKNQEDAPDEDTICGIGFFKPKWIQKWATSKMFLFWYSITLLIHSSFYNYFIGMISTLEKRYAYKTKISTSIMLGEEVMVVFFGIALGYFGNKAHRPRFLAVGNLMLSSCAFCAALPYFLYGSEKFEALQGVVKSKSDIQLCSGEDLTCEIDDRPPTITVVVLLFTAFFLKGFSNIAQNIVGVPYIDDNTKKKNTPIYFALAFAFRLLGPLFGYLLSSACLSFYEDPFDDPGYGPQDPRWVGAWWIGFLIQGTLMLIFNIPVALFPRRLPGRKEPEPISPVEEESFKDYLTGFLRSVKRMVKNPLLMFQIFSTVMKLWGHFGFGVLLPKYMENQFKMTAAQANLYSGATSVACTMVGIVGGGLLIWKYQPKPKFLLITMIISEMVLVCGFLVQMIPGCATMDLQNFGKNNEGFILNGTCNLNCGCSTSKYTPFCGPDGKTEFFSPCHAGCTELLPQLSKSEDGQPYKLYRNCSCITDDYGADAQITEGYCPKPECKSQAIIYIGLMLFLTIVTSIFGVAYQIVLLRSVHPKDKGVALGFYETCISVFGYIPFPPIFGSMVDSTCLVWEKSCEETGNCWVYDMDHFNYRLHCVAAGFSFLGALGICGLLYFRDRLQDLYEDDGDSEPHNQMLEMKSDSETKM